MDNNEWDGSEVLTVEETIFEDNVMIVRKKTKTAYWEEITNQSVLILVEDMKASAGFPEAQPGATLTMGPFLDGTMLEFVKK